MGKEMELRAEDWKTTLPFVAWFSVNVGVGLYGSGSLDAAREFFTGVAYAHAHDHARLVQFYNQAPVFATDLFALSLSLAAALRENIRPSRQTDQTEQETVNSDAPQSSLIQYN